MEESEKRGYFSIVFDYHKSYWYISLIVAFLVILALFFGSYKIAGLNISGIILILISLFYLIGNITNAGYFTRLPRMQIAAINNNEKANKIRFLIMFVIGLILGIIIAFGIYCPNFLRSGLNLC